MEMERKEFRLDTVTTDAGSFEGYASVHGVLDRVGDVVMPGAYTKTLPTFLRDGVIHWAHDFATPVAWPTAAYEDARGLFLAGKFHSTPAGQNARTVTAERLAAGMSMGLSIGYKVEDYRYRDDGVRELHEIELLEVSLVTLPAQAEATVTDVKCIDCLGPSQTAASGQCPDSQSLSPEERKELEEIHHRVLDMELDRLNEHLSYRRGLAADAERGVGWAVVPTGEVCVDLRLKADIALLNAALELGILPPPLRWFAEATASDEIAFTAPPLWGVFRKDGAVWINDAVRDVVAVVSHEVWHAKHSEVEERIAGAEEAAAQEYGEAASARWHSQ